MASARIQRWSLTLAAYSYKLSFKDGKLNNNADALSQLPLPEMPAFVPMPAETVFLMEFLESSPVTAKQIKYWTYRDPILSQVRHCVLYGWSEKSLCDPVFRPFKARKTELSVHSGCLLLWGARVVVPSQGQARIVEELHSSHPGVSRMKTLAWGYVWWPGLDNDL